ncbi:hypothetical protein B0J15DRAFT_494883 [Fusarium solani]|uniref:HEAT repeat domain-containing protein n=1 Tax=Fusarium solani TaxID=169388 RepID=A0A9P9HD97_FUSSL|nr:uncharacterized protein B0J15DRAFT_494883 [Fusarium solani]KAH7254798.1 hypothetical protein B0J15DRAFT_494883 [Fusarium solani]
MMTDAAPSDPLAGLDDIDWASLQHAYGSAEDVPALLKALRFHDKNELDQVYFALSSNILHQGTRYQATSYAVPFLYALLDAKDTPRREDLLYYLVNVALGHPSASVPSGVEITKWRTLVAKTQQPNFAEDERRKKDEYIAAATDDKDRQRREDEFLYRLSTEKMAERQLNGLRAYDAVRGGLDYVYECLKDGNPDLRAVAAFCLGFFPEDKVKAEGEILALLGHEGDVAVRGTALISIALLQAPSLGDLLQTEVAQYLKTTFNNQDSDEASKWSSAIGLAILRIYEPETINTILQAIADDNYLSILQRDHCKRFPFAYPDLASLAASVLKVKGSESPQVTRITLAQLEGSKGQTTWYLTELLLESAFDGKPLSETKPFSELTELQQETLRALVRLDQSTWSWGNFVRILTQGGVPSTKEALDAYIDGKEVKPEVPS